MSIASRIDDAPPRAGLAVLKRTVINLVLWAWSMINFARMREGRPRPAWARPSRLLIGAAGAVALVVFAMFTVDGLAISQQRHLPSWVVESFESITDLGRSGWVLTPLGLAIILLAAVSSGALGRVSQLVLASVVARVGFLFMAVAVPGVVVTIAKRLIGRARPYSWETGGPLAFEPFRWHVEYASLPSGHGTTAFAAAFALGALYPRIRVPVWAFAVLVALSRVAVSAHYPSDVLAGAVIGVFGALAVRNWFAARRLAFMVLPDRSVRPLPGPSWRRLRAVARRIAA
jgi:membrane-associated phospholipid phosphatase